MTRIQQKPIVHGRDHLPGGPDPIPGPSGAGAFSGYVQSFDSLIGYWRLGEGASPFADTSGHVDGPCDLEKTATGTAMDEDVTGGLPAAQDDGAVEFNAANTTAGDYLSPVAGTGGTIKNRFNLANAPYTIAAWIRPDADAASFNGIIVSSGNVSSGGWWLGVVYPGRTVFHARRTSGGTQTFAIGSAVTAGAWIFVTATWDPTAGHELFYNGASVDTDPGTTIVPSIGQGPYLGRLNTGSSFGSYPGRVDELAIWSEVLTDDEIAGLYARGVGSVGDTTGQVLTSDGEGGTSWAFPTTKVEGTRYDEILAGTNITATDNTDGTVTLDASGGGSGIPDTIVDAKGDLIAASAADTVARFPVGSNDQVLVADSGQTLGIKWAAVPGTSAFVPVSTIDAKGDLLVGSANDAVDNLTVGSNNQVLTADSGQTLGVKWATPSGGGATELAYNQFTSPVSITVTTEGTATVLVTASTFTADGTTKYCVEFYAPSVEVGNQIGAGTMLILLEASTVLGQIARIENSSASNRVGGPVLTRRYVTPSSGSRTYKVSAYKIGTPSPNINVGSGGTGAWMPGYIRVTSGG